MLKRLHTDVDRQVGISAVPATSHEFVRSRVLLLGGPNPETCIAQNTRRLIDAATSCIDWVVPGNAGSLTPSPVSLEQPQPVLSAPAAGPAPWQHLQDGLFATLTMVRGLPGLYWPQTAGFPDITIVRLLDQPANRHKPGAGLPALYRTISLAFQYARLNGQHGVIGTCDTRLLGSPGNMFELAFRQVAAQFPDLAAECLGVSRCSRRIVQGTCEPMTIVASGSTADALASLAASASVTAHLVPEIHAGDQAMVFTSQSAGPAGFADCGYANPTGCILSAVSLLNHLGADSVAEAIQHALLVTLEDGSELTPDIACRYPGVSTRQFTNAVIANLGSRSSRQSAAQWPVIRLPGSIAPVLGQVVNQ